MWLDKRFPGLFADGNNIIQTRLDFVSIHTGIDQPWKGEALAQKVFRIRNTLNGIREIVETHLAKSVANQSTQVFAVRSESQPTSYHRVVRKTFESSKITYTCDCLAKGRCAHVAAVADFLDDDEGYTKFVRAPQPLNERQLLFFQASKNREAFAGRKKGTRKRTRAAALLDESAVFAGEQALKRKVQLTKKSVAELQNLCASNGLPSHLRKNALIDALLRHEFKEGAEKEQSDEGSDSDNEEEEEEDNKEVADETEEHECLNHDSPAIRSDGMTIITF